MGVIDMKKLFSLLLASLLMIASCAAASAQGDVFIRIDRDAPEAWQRPLDNVRFLDDEHMSGSAQFSAAQFETLEEQLRAHADGREVWIVDCRLESHGLINSIAISWCDNENAANRGKTAAEVEADEATLSALIGTEVTAWTAVSDRPDIPVQMTVETWQTERDLVETAGFRYLRLACPDHGWPPAEVIDDFLAFADGLGEDAWLHFHCQAGSGRTGAFMTIWEMLQKPDAPLEEILQHQADTGSGNLVTPSAPEKTHAQKSRYVMVRAFHRYLTERCDGTWSDWLSAHSETVTLHVGESLGIACVTSDALVVNEEGMALATGMATVLTEEKLLTVEVVAVAEQERLGTEKTE